MKINASEAVIGKFYEVEGRRRLCTNHSRINSQTGFFLEDGSRSWIANDTEITPLAVTGWGDEPEPEHPPIPEGWEIKPGTRCLRGELYCVHGVNDCWQTLREAEYTFDSPVTIIRRIEPKSPDPGEGWRIATGDDWKDTRCQQLVGKHWMARMPSCIGRPFDTSGIYRVPTPPAYRPFANAAEFRPHRDKWVRCLPEQHETNRVCTHNDVMFWFSRGSGTTFKDGFRDCVFDDGSPFGIEVTK